MKQAEKMIQDIEREKQKSEEEQPKAEFNRHHIHCFTLLYEWFKNKGMKKYLITLLIIYMMLYQNKSGEVKNLSLIL